MPARDMHSEASSRLAAVIATATDGIIIITERGIMDVVNDAAARLFGYDKSEMEGNNVSMLMPQPDRGNHDGYMHNYMSTGVAKIIGIGREVQGQKKDGTVFPLRLSISEVQTVFDPIQLLFYRRDRQCKNCWVLFECRGKLIVG